MQNGQRTTMNVYVGVTNDVSVAVKSILQVKKAYRTQMKCHEALTRKNELTQQRIGQLEKQNKDLENKLIKLGSDNQTGIQMKCHEELTRKNKSLQKRSCEAVVQIAKLGVVTCRTDALLRKRKSVNQILRDK